MPVWREKHHEIPISGVQSDQGAWLNDRANPNIVLVFNPQMFQLGFDLLITKMPLGCKTLRLELRPGKIAGNVQPNPNLQLGFGVKRPYWDFEYSDSPTDRENGRKKAVGICTTNPNR